MQLYALASMTSWVYSIVWTPQSADRQPGARYFKVKSHQPPKKCISNYHIGNIKGLKTYFDTGQIKIYWGDKENKILSWSYWYCATSSLYISILWPTYKCKTTEFASFRDMKWIVTTTFDWPKQRTFENWGNSNNWRRKKIIMAMMTTMMKIEMMMTMRRRTIRIRTMRTGWRAVG